jgi:hypothetical protein
MKSLSNGNLKHLFNKTWFMALLYTSFFVSMQLTDWRPIRYWNLRGEGTNFIDTEQVLNWTQCYKNVGDQIFQAEGFCSGYIYGKIIPVLFTVIPSNDYLVGIVGYVFLLMIAIVLGATTASLSTMQMKLFSAIVFISPPVLLLVERGNFDSVMVGLVSLAAMMLNQNRKFFSFAFISFASSIKFYTLPLLLIFIFENSRKKINYIYLPGVFLVTFLVYEGIRNIKSSFPTDSTYKFGMSIWIRYLPAERIPFNVELLANLVGLIIFFLVAVVVSIAYKSKIWSSINILVEEDKNKVNFFNLFFLCHAICFFSGMSYDYRLIFLAVSGIYFLSLRTSSAGVDSLVKALLVISVWLTYPSGGLQPIGDLAICVITFLLSIEFLKLNSLPFGAKRVMRGDGHDL